jgi:plastocyanin
VIAGAAALAATGVAVPAGAGPDGQAAATRSVSVQDNFFAPRSRTVQRNDSVRFDWSRAENPHNVIWRSSPRRARRPRNCSLRTTGACTRTFRKRGTYRYVCTIHLLSDDMRGRIRVE